MKVKRSSGSADTLTMEDAEAIEESIEGISAIAPEVSSQQQIIFKGENNMPNGDGTGPNGDGPNTGQGQGPCPPTPNGGNK